MLPVVSFFHLVPFTVDDSSCNDECEQFLFQHHISFTKKENKCESSLSTLVHLMVKKLQSKNRTLLLAFTLQNEVAGRWKGVCLPSSDWMGCEIRLEIHFGWPFAFFAIRAQDQGEEAQWKCFAHFLVELFSESRQWIADCNSALRGHFGPCWLHSSFFLADWRSENSKL